MRSTEILREEHDAVLAVLTQLDNAIEAAERGRPVPKDIFADIEEFFTVFVDQCHHGKEETAVFDKLGTTDESQHVATSLTQEHESGRELSAQYRAAVSAYVPGVAESAHGLARAARAYEEMLRQHIEEENTELFPLMEQSLSDQDTQITSEFDRIELEEIGEGTHERLHHMIDSLPDRIAPWV